MQVVMRPPCECPACLKGKKVVSQAELGRHFGIDYRLMRDLIADGLPGHTPASRTHPVYSIDAAEAWMSTRGQRGAA